MKNRVLSALLAASVLFAPMTASASGYIIQEPAATSEGYKLPELSYSFAAKGSTLTLTTDVYLVAPDTWAYIVYERKALPQRLQLEFDEKLAIEKEKARLVLDIRETQIEYLNNELETNKLLQKVQKQKSVKDWTPLIVAGAVILGALITTTTVFAVTNGDGV
jgi:methionine-rich copper-binding protein CopC